MFPSIRFLLFLGSASVVQSISYMRMPYSESYWSSAQSALQTLIARMPAATSPSSEIARALRTFNPGTADYDYTALKAVEAEPYWKSLMTQVVPKIAQAALRLPQLLPSPGLRILRSNEVGTVTLTQEQAHSLMANSFFCLFPPKLDTFPRNKFCTLFSASEKFGTSHKIEKLKGFLHYFLRMSSKPRPGSLLTYERLYLPPSQLPDWSPSRVPLQSVWVKSSGVIEDSENYLQVDFANKYLGGGILNDGATQEELRFVINPELLVSSFIFEKLEDTEAAVITGVERFSSTTGYSSQLRWSTDYVDTTPLDNMGRRNTAVVAMDALKFTEGREYEQWWYPQFTRELGKAYVGFSGAGAKPIATGNWGAGAFNGDAQLKFLIQWMAASQLGKKMEYYTHKDEGQKDEIVGILNQMKTASRPVTVGLLFQAERLYKEKVVDKHQQDNYSLFKFLREDADCRRLLNLS